MYDEPVSFSVAMHRRLTAIWLIFGASPLNLDISKQLGRGVEGFTANFSIVFFARKLAKIGYSYAVAKLGLDGFKPLALDLIMRRKEYDGNLLVGGT